MYNTNLAVVEQRPQAAPIYQGAKVVPFQISAAESYIEYVDRKPTTTKGYVSCLRQFANWYKANDIGQPTTADIKAYRSYLQNDTDLKPSTINQYLRAVKSFFAWLHRETGYPNVADNVHGLKIDRRKHKKDALKPADVKKILATIPTDTETGKRDRAIFLLMTVNGLRDVEVSRATVGDISIIDGTPFLYLWGKGHDEADAPVYLDTAVKQAIDGYLQARTDKYDKKSPLFVATGNRNKPGTKIYKKDESGNYVYDENGKKVVDKISDGSMAASTISSNIKTVLVNAGYDSERITPHSLRHSSGTAAYKAGNDLLSIQRLMRHCDPATSEIYIHTDDDTENEIQGRKAIYNYLYGDDDGVQSKRTKLASMIQDIPADLLDDAIAALQNITKGDTE